jgi:hypothetical protein
LLHKLFEQGSVGEALLGLVSGFAESPVDGTHERRLAAQAGAINQDISPVLPDFAANLPALLRVRGAHKNIYQTLFINLGVAVCFLVSLCSREGNQTLFDFFERDARISTPHRINVNPRQRPVQELLGS